MDKLEEVKKILDEYREMKREIQHLEKCIDMLHGLLEFWSMPRFKDSSKNATFNVKARNSKYEYCSVNRPKVFFGTDGSDRAYSYLDYHQTEQLVSMLEDNLIVLDQEYKKFKHKILKVLNNNE
jgi:hypothetical protein